MLSCLPAGSTKIEAKTREVRRPFVIYVNSLSLNTTAGALSACLPAVEFGRRNFSLSFFFFFFLFSSLFLSLFRKMQLRTGYLRLRREEKSFANLISIFSSSNPRTNLRFESRDGSSISAGRGIFYSRLTSWFFHGFNEHNMGIMALVKLYISYVPYVSVQRAATEIQEQTNALRSTSHILSCARKFQRPRILLIYPLT